MFRHLSSYFKLQNKRYLIASIHARQEIEIHVRPPPDNTKRAPHNGAQPSIYISKKLDLDLESEGRSSSIGLKDMARVIFLPNIIPSETDVKLSQ